MKKIIQSLRYIVIFTLCILSFTSNAFAQNPDNETEKIATFCKVWGFLKYYHPEVAIGKIDWDKEFTSRISSLNSLQTKQEISDYYAKWINGLAKVEKCEKCDNDIADKFKMNLDLKWLSDTNVFSPNLINTLQYIQQNRNHRNYFYVQKGRYQTPSFANEKKILTLFFHLPISVYYLFRGIGTSSIIFILISI